MIKSSEVKQSLIESAGRSFESNASIPFPKIKGSLPGSHRHSFRRFLGPLFLGLSILFSAGDLLAQKKAATKSKACKSASVDINRATLQELRSLPGIGTITAQRILEFRDRNGPFRRVEELLIIRGISENKFQQILPCITPGKAGILTKQEGERK